jgi:hypothetical protein
MAVAPLRRLSRAAAMAAAVTLLLLLRRQQRRRRLRRQPSRVPRRRAAVPGYSGIRDDPADSIDYERTRECAGLSGLSAGCIVFPFFLR